MLTTMLSLLPNWFLFTSKPRMLLKPDLTLRYMAVMDLPQVTAIDRLAFDIPWSIRSYEYELAESNNSFMEVLEYSFKKSQPFWQRWLPGLNGNGKREHHIAGYGGLWQIGGEAHISTIAVHPSVRGRGWGEILLAGMVRRSIMLEAEEVVLEVRVSNIRAQNLYRKYEFQTLLVKEGYYRNNDEDAYEMHLNIRSRAVLSHFAQRYNALLARHGFRDLYSPDAPPRKAA
jgi:[ribosomal protein S18]-alanine N-acetyltransferase